MKFIHKPTYSCQKPYCGRAIFQSAHSWYGILSKNYLISCSSVLKISSSKNSVIVISKPSHNFLSVITDKSFLLESIILYTVEGVTPARVASSLYVIFISLQIFFIRKTIASFMSKLPLTNHFLSLYSASSSGKAISPFSFSKSFIHCLMRYKI